MSYATPDEVKSLFRDFAEPADAAVTDAEIQEFLDDASNIIDAKVGTLYSLPITLGSNPKSFSILKRLETFKVACIIDDILNNYSEADKKPMWCKKAQELMNEIIPPIDKKTCRQCMPTLILPDATYNGTIQQRNKITINKKSGTIFTKGGDNW
jgi:hypothetical protein